MQALQANVETIQRQKSIHFFLNAFKIDDTSAMNSKLTSKRYIYSEKFITITKKIYLKSEMIYVYTIYSFFAHVNIKIVKMSYVINDLMNDGAKIYDRMNSQIGSTLRLKVNN